MKRPAVPVTTVKARKSVKDEARKAAVTDGGKTVKSEPVAEPESTKTAKPEPCAPINLDQLGDDAMVREKHVLSSVALVSRATFLRWLEDEVFPKPIRIGACRFWRVGDIRRWLREQATKNAVVGGAQ